MLDRNRYRLGSDQILTRLTAGHPKLIDLSLDRIERLLIRLGHPQHSLAPVVHVAGTNGKGSTIAFMRAILEAAGYRVQAYISPHLIDFRERIRLTDGLIEEQELAAVLEECENANSDEPITYFEMTTAAALVAFSRQPADVLLLEVGLGGRFDATNVISRPALCVVTPISADHQQFLGHTLAAIAHEKAGILKPGVPVVVGPQPDAALDVVTSQAVELDAPIFAFGAHWRVAADGGRSMRYSDRDGELVLPLPALSGPHQITNAGVAIAGIRSLAGADVDRASIAAGLEGAEWPARLQLLDGSSLAGVLPQGWDLWLDGGHNPAAAAVLREFFGNRRPLHLIIGMMANKNIMAYLEPFRPLATSLHAIEIPGETGCLAPEDIRDAALGLDIPADTAKGAGEALETIAGDCKGGRPQTVLICGSLYLAGSVLRTI